MSDAPYIFYVKSARATFRVVFSKDYDSVMTPDGPASIYVGLIVTIGGKHTPACLQLNVPYKGTHGKLMWLESSLGCAIETDNPLVPTEIKGSLTEHMCHVGFSLAKRINSSIRFLELQDSAAFKCILPDGNPYAINMTDHDIAFYQQTYYERRYKAQFLSNDIQEQYKSLLSNFTDPGKKPAMFNFMYDALREKLLPIYISSATWKEFFDKIRTTYKYKKCQVVYPWLKDALFHIFDHHRFSGYEHIIDIHKNPIVDFTRIYLGGSRTRRRETRKRQRIIHSLREATPPELAAMDWEGFLRGVRHRRT